MLLMHPKENQTPLWFRKAICSGRSFLSSPSTSCQLREAASVHLQGTRSGLLPSHRPPGPWQPGPHWLDTPLSRNEPAFRLQVAGSFDHPSKPGVHSFREPWRLGRLNMQCVWPCYLVMGARRAAQKAPESGLCSSRT